MLTTEVKVNFNGFDIAEVLREYFTNWAALPENAHHFPKNWEVEDVETYEDDADGYDVIFKGTH